MKDVSVARRSGGPTTIDGAAVEALQSSLHGTLILAGEDGYDEARAIWNGMSARARSGSRPPTEGATSASQS
jgi:hypothetical protein